MTDSISQRVTEIRRERRRRWRNIRWKFSVRFKKIVQEVWFRLTRYWGWGAGIVIAALAGALIWDFQDTLAQWICDLWTWSRIGDPKVPNAETLRNLIWGIGGGSAAFIGVGLAIWRSILAHLQARTAERGLNNERYQKGADMLESTTLAARMGGVHALENLAQERPYDYHIQISKLLCAFIRPQTDQDKPGAKAANGEVGKRTCPPAIEAAAQVLSKRGKKQIRIERREGFHLRIQYANLLRASLLGANFSDADLQDANLAGASLHRADFSSTCLVRANLSGARLYRADLSRAVLALADFSGAELRGADLSGASFQNTILNGTILSDATLDRVKYLTQAQLDAACIWKGGKPPTLVGAVDFETGKPLKWRGEERPYPFTRPQPPTP